uniref:Uncharacterized protein n=1 Tax=Yoonia rhodophyticola TaxID=3137370 RepID=A0AAN0NM08_9RHOB
MARVVENPNSKSSPQKCDPHCKQSTTPPNITRGFITQPDNVASCIMRCVGVRKNFKAAWKEALKL